MLEKLVKDYLDLKGINTDDEDSIKLLSDLRDADEDALWLQCLESAGVDNWSGYDYASDLFREESGND